MKRLYISSLLFLISYMALGQHSHIAYKKLADSLYEHHHYQSAATYYEKAIKKAPQPGNIMLQIAKCYNRMNRINEAEQWYIKARSNHAQFSMLDNYQYVYVLTMLQKRSEAEGVLQEILNNDPNALYARQLLGDIQNQSKYYKDSALYRVNSLSINTAVSEFAPSFYKDGIVFSSAQPDHFTKKKYHWDNSHFLKLYYSSINANESFQQPVIFDKELDSRFHDGPVTFYAGGERMIINRNQPLKVSGKKETWIWHLSLYDAQRSKVKDKDTWQLIAFTFDEPPHSFAHPTIVENGNVLYFISDKPGGYGGTDIYRVVKKDGIWSKPYNLGPAINTPGNEVFPFIVDNTLYFASNGHGGLGGLDIFKSVQTVNGFSPPVNMGVPINSPADDFAFITRSNHSNGYFSSSRNGNDDIFSFNKLNLIKMVARVFDGETNNPLPEASIQLISNSGKDISLSPDKDGLIEFELPEETAYVIVGNKDNLVGMVSGFAILSENEHHMIHSIPLYGDTTRIACIGTVKNEMGSIQNAVRIHITDETTGKELGHTQDNSFVNFLGEKGHTYRIEIANEQGDTTLHTISLGTNQTGSHTWSMVLKESSSLVKIATRAYNADNNLPLSGATIKIITFSETEQDLVASEEGITEFSLPPGTAYMVVANKDGFTGMHSGISGTSIEKEKIIHPIPAYSDPAHPVPVMALLTNSAGEIIENVKAIVTEKSSGENIPVEIIDGVLAFLGERGKEYNISAEHQNHQPVLEEVNIPIQATTFEKLSIVMEEKETSSNAGYKMAVRVFKENIDAPLAYAQVKIITPNNDELGLIADNEGVADFILPEGTAYLAIADKDGYTGMSSGFVTTGTAKASMIHPIMTHTDPPNQLPVIAYITNKQGDRLVESNVIVIEKTTGEKIPMILLEGTVSFYGEKGKEYIISVDHRDYEPSSNSITIPNKSIDIQKSTIALDSKSFYTNNTPAETHMVLTVTDQQGNTPNDVIEISPDNKIQVESENNNIPFNGKRESDSIIEAVQSEYLPVTKQITIPAQPSEEDKVLLTPENKSLIADSNQFIKELPVSITITDERGNALQNAFITVREKSSGKKIPVELTDNSVIFNGYQNGEYIIEVTHDDYLPVAQPMRITTLNTAQEEISISLTKNKSAKKAMQTMAIHVVKAESEQPLPGAQVHVVSFDYTDQHVVTNENGLVDFMLPENVPYIVIATKDGNTGIFTGKAEKGMDYGLVTHKVLTHPDNNKQLSVVGRIADENGSPISVSRVHVTNKSTGEVIAVTMKDGLLHFFGEKEGTYSIEIDADGYESLATTLTIEPSATGTQNIQISLAKPTKKTAGLSNMIILNSNDHTSKFYISSAESHHEIVEKEGILYLENEHERKSLGKGSLSQLKEDPSPVMLALGLSSEQIISIQNIYFDFNKALLDDSDKEELNKVRDIFKHYPTLQLTISAHADERGRDTYNMNLSKKRARAVESYLVRQGISSKRIHTQAHGESIPVVTCNSPDCSEDDHQKNRRAELSLGSSPTRYEKLIKKESERTVSNTTKSNNSQSTMRIVSNANVAHEKRMTYEEVVERYGDKQISGLTFKVSVGAYRYNPNLTFDNLRDLGTINKSLEKGINFYYLSEFNTLRSAENIRQQVIARGITDAYISIFYKGEKISFPVFIALEVEHHVENSITD